jgi:hypothetical protein
MCTLVALRGKDYRKEVLGTHVRSRF